MPEIGFTMNNIFTFGDIIYCYLWLDELPERELLELPERDELLEFPERELFDVDDDLLLGAVDDDLLFALPELPLP